MLTVLLMSVSRCLTAAVDIDVSVVDPYHSKLVHFRSKDGGVEPAGRGIVPGAGDRLPGRARAARWAVLPCAPCQTSSLCGSLISCVISNSRSLCDSVGISTVTIYEL